MEEKVDVLLATYNGEKYLKEQHTKSNIPKYKFNNIR